MSSNTLNLKKKVFVSININTKDQNISQYEILNSLAFELRTPVTVMKSNIQFLKKFCMDGGHPCVDDSFLMCEDSVDNILRFINSVNFLSDPKSLKLKKINFNLNLFLHQVMEELSQSNYDVSRIKVNRIVSNIYIITDKYLLNRILINLLVNALKFSSSNVELDVYVRNNQLIIEVRDYGIGIPEEEIKDIFKPFVRAHNVKMIGGTGLGLSIVSKAVDYLGGAVYVNSIIGYGTEFKVIIPFETIIEMN